MSSVFALLYRRPVLVLGILFSVGIAFVLWSFTTLSQQIYKETSRNHAELFTHSLDKAREFYSANVTSRVKFHGVVVSHDYLKHEISIPNPATFTIELGNIISTRDGISARLYSDYPFPGRDGGGVKNPFEGEAIGFFRGGLGDTFSRVQEVDGVQSLRFAQAIRMSESCVECHNSHPQSPKTNWKVGDVRGVQSVTLPMTTAAKTIRRGVLQTSGAMLGLTLVGIIFLSLVVTRLRQTNSATARFVPKRFLKILGKHDIIQVRLGDCIATEMTVMFTDIRSFTTMSESMSPNETFQFVNRYLELMEPVIRAHNGFIDKYIGDAIMALFPDPEDAAMAGIEMLRILEVANREDAFDGKPVQIGMGLNTGTVMLGTVGGSGRMEGTVIGDAVNVAARLESMTKEHGTMLVSQSTADRLQKFEKRLVTTVTLRGRSRQTDVYEVLWRNHEKQ